jgi:hypothetical protein
MTNSGGSRVDNIFIINSLDNVSIALKAIAKGYDKCFNTGYK